MKLRALWLRLSVAVICLGALSPIASAQVCGTVIQMTSPTPNPAVQGTPVTFSVGVQATLPCTTSAVPSGTISVADTLDGVTTTLATGTLVASTGTNQYNYYTFNVTFTDTTASTQQHTLAASYSGDANYAAGSSTAKIETVLPSYAATSTSITGLSPNPATAGLSVAFTAEITYTLTQNTRPTGTVTFTDTNTGNTLGTGNVTNIGGGHGTPVVTQASFTTSSLAAGSYAVQAKYSGDAIYAASSSAVVTLTVQQGTISPSSTTFMNPLPPSQATTGQQLVFNVQVSGTGAPAGVGPTGSVSFTDGATVLAQVALDAVGQATLTTSFSTTGTHAITATYGGDANFSGSTSAALDVLVSAPPLAQSATTLSSQSPSSPNPPTTLDPVTLTGTVTGGSGTPTGTVTFYEGGCTGTVLGAAAQTLSGGTVSLNIGTLAQGVHTLCAVYNGDSTYSGSSGMLTLVVNAATSTATQTTVSSSANPSVFGQSVTFTATVTGSGGTPTGTVTFSLGSSIMVPAPLDANGHATITSSALPVGSVVVSAVYSGDSTYQGNNSPTLTQLVNQASTSTAVTTSGSAVYGTSVTITATTTVNSPGAGTPTGTVTFANGSTTLCSDVTLSSGQATCSTSSLPLGSQTITATYSGDTHFLASSGSLTLTVNSGADVNLSPQSLTFASQDVNTSSAAQTVTLTNTGTATLAISNIAVSGDFSQSNTCGSSVLAGAKCTFSVTFTPTAAGTRAGSISISDNAPGSPHTIVLSGTGEDFALAAASGSSLSASVSPGQSATYTLSVSAQGGMNQNVSFTCTGAPSESTCTVLPNSVTLGGTPTNITVTLTTTAPSASPPHSRPLPPVSPFSPGAWNLVMLMLLLAGAPWAFRHRRPPRVRPRWAGLAALTAGFLLVLTMAGCGGGQAPASNVTRDPGTPAGTYQVTVTGSTGTGSQALSHSITLTLTVT